MEAFTSYRRNLPHFRIPGSIYFVTWRIKPGVRDLSPDERTLVRDSLHFFHLERYFLHVWGVMNDHVHVLVRPYEGFALEKIVVSWKSYTARQISALRAQPFQWMREYMDRIVRGAREMERFTSYILDNPRRRWPGIEAYPWVGVNLDDGPAVVDSVPLPWDGDLNHLKRR